MKIKSIPAVCAAFAVFCATSAFASAETAPAELSANDLLAVTDDSVRDAASASAENKTKSGAEGVAAVVGAISLAGAAVVISRKKA